MSKYPLMVEEVALLVIVVVEGWMTVEGSTSECVVRWTIHLDLNIIGWGHGPCRCFVIVKRRGGGREGSISAWVFVVIWMK